MKNRPQFVSSTVETTQANPGHLIILSGQSNMDNLDIERFFAPHLAELLNGEPFRAIKRARNRQPIRRWLAEWAEITGQAPEKGDGAIFKRLTNDVMRARKSGFFETVSFVWMQGEADAKASNGDFYEKALLALKKKVTFIAEPLPVNFVFGRLADTKLRGSYQTEWLKVQQVQEKVASHPRSKLVMTDDLNGPRKELHYTEDGYELFGKRLALACADLINQNRYEPSLLPDAWPH